MIELIGFVVNKKCKNRQMQHETQGQVNVEGPPLSTISRLFRVQDFIPSNEALKSQGGMDLPPTYAELFEVQRVPTDQSSGEPYSARSAVEPPPSLPTSTPNPVTTTRTKRIFVASRFAVYLEPPPLSTLH